MKDFEVKASRLIYQNRWITLKEFEITRRGSSETYSMVEREDCVIIIPISPSKQTVLLKQFRYPIEKDSWELPMGGIEDGETPEEAAQRELFEETGLSATNLEYICSYHAAPGLTSQKAYIFVCYTQDADLSEIVTPKDQDDIQALRVMDIDRVFRIARDGGIGDSFTLVGLLFLRFHLDDELDAQEEVTRAILG